MFLTDSSLSISTSGVIWAKNPNPPKCTPKTGTDGSEKILTPEMSVPSPPKQRRKSTSGGFCEEKYETSESTFILFNRSAK